MRTFSHLPPRKSLSLSQYWFPPGKAGIAQVEDQFKKNKNNQRKCAIFGFHCLIRCEDHKGLLLVWSGDI